MKGKYKPNYTERYRGLIIKTILSCGFVPYNAIEVMETQSPRSVKKAIKKMIDEGILIKPSVVNSRKVYRLVCFANYSSSRNLFKNLDDSLFEEYESHGKADLKHARYNAGGDSMRVINNCSMKILMGSLGMTSLTNTSLAEIDIQKDTPRYYTAREIKNIVNYEPTIEEEYNRTSNKFSKKITTSRVTGVLTSPGGIYSIYNFGPSLPSKRSGEYKWKAYLRDILSEKGISSRLSNNMILFTDTYEKLSSLFTGSTSVKNGFESLRQAYGDGYIFALPFDKNGKDMIRIMTMKEWKTIIKNTFPQNIVFDVADKEYTCDAYGSQSGTYILIFMIPDLLKLERFIIDASSSPESLREKFSIFCFDFQRDFLASVAGDFCEIRSLEFEKYKKLLFRNN